MGTSITKFSPEGNFLLHNMCITLTETNQPKSLLCAVVHHGPQQPAQILLPFVLGSRPELAVRGQKEKVHLLQA